MAIRYPLVLNGSQIQELQEGDSLAGSAERADTLKVGVSYRSASIDPLSNTIPARDSSGDLYANVFRGVATSAQYADLAEKYIPDENYEAGTVVVFGGQNEITVTDTLADTRVAGVVSSSPAYIMNSESMGIAVALRGKVPVKVIGRVAKGDLLVTSTSKGVATVEASPAPYTVFAKSIEDKETDELGVVMAVIL